MAKQSVKCANIIDGDTFDTDTGIRIILARVNAPPIITKRGQEAKKLLESLIFQKLITYETVARDTYGRQVAEVWIDSSNVNDVMVDVGQKLQSHYQP